MRLRRHPSVLPGFGLSLGYTFTYLSIIVLVPLALHFLLRALPERVREDARFAAARRRVSPTGPSGR